MAFDPINGGDTVGIGMTHITRFVAITGIGCAILVGVNRVVTYWTDVTCIRDAVFVRIFVVIRFLAGITGIGNPVFIVV